MNKKIDEYKKKVNYDVWADVSNLQKIFQDGIINHHKSISKKPKKSEGETEQ